MSLSMLEQIALRFETYASDQEAVNSRFTPAKIDAAANKARANCWRDAAKELRQIGADNREAFLRDMVELTVKPEGLVLSDMLALFITPPIPAATPRDPLRDTKSNTVTPETFVNRAKLTDMGLPAGTVTGRFAHENATIEERLPTVFDEPSVKKIVEDKE